MKKLLCLGVLLLFFLNVGDVFAQQMTSWEIKWNFYGVRHEGLMILAGNTGTFRVLCYNRKSGNLFEVVDQFAIATQVRDGVVINCSNPTSHYGGAYSADNFKVFNNGSMYMMDDNGNWSTEIWMRQIVNLNDLAKMKNKYGL